MTQTRGRRGILRSEAPWVCRNMPSWVADPEQQPLPQGTVDLLEAYQLIQKMQLPRQIQTARGNCSRARGQMHRVVAPWHAQRWHHAPETKIRARGRRALPTEAAQPTRVAAQSCGGHLGYCSTSWGTRSCCTALMTSPCHYHYHLYYRCRCLPDHRPLLLGPVRPCCGQARGQLQEGPEEVPAESSILQLHGLLPSPCLRIQLQTRKAVRYLAS